MPLSSSTSQQHHVQPQQQQQRWKREQVLSDASNEESVALIVRNDADNETQAQPRCSTRAGKELLKTGKSFDTEKIEHLQPLFTEEAVDGAAAEQLLLNESQEVATVAAAPVKKKCRRIRHFQKLQQPRRNPAIDRILTILEDKRITDEAELYKLQDLQMPRLRKALNAIFILLGVSFLLAVIGVIGYTSFF